MTKILKLVDEEAMALDVVSADTLTIKRGFGPGKVKEWFVVTMDGDTWNGIVSNGFESGEQADQAREALKPLYPFRRLGVMAGHMDGFQDKPWPAGTFENEKEWEPEILILK